VPLHARGRRAPPRDARARSHPDAPLERRKTDRGVDRQPVRTELATPLRLFRSARATRPSPAAVALRRKPTTPSSRRDNTSAPPTTDSHLQVACLPTPRRCASAASTASAAEAVAMSRTAGSDDLGEPGDGRRGAASTVVEIVLCTSEHAVTRSGRVHTHRRGRRPAGRCDHYCVACADGAAVSCRRATETIASRPKRERVAAASDCSHREGLQDCSPASPLSAGIRPYGG
jgi:hypothetical protein